MNYQHEEKWTEELRTYGTVNEVNIRIGQQPYHHNPNLSFFAAAEIRTRESLIAYGTLLQPVSWRYILPYDLDV